jgi:hypothetical protein
MATISLTPQCKVLGRALYLKELALSWPPLDLEKTQWGTFTKVLHLKDKVLYLLTMIVTTRWYLRINSARPTNKEWPRLQWTKRVDLLQFSWALKDTIITRYSAWVGKSRFSRRRRLILQLNESLTSKTLPKKTKWKPSKFWKDNKKRLAPLWEGYHRVRQTMGLYVTRHRLSKSFKAKRTLNSI